MLSGAGAGVTDGVGGIGETGAAAYVVVTGTLEAGTPSTSKDKLPETLLSRTEVPPLPTWVTFNPWPMWVVVAGSEERMLPLTLLSSALQCVSGGTSNRTEPDTELKWYGPPDTGV